MCSLSSKVLSDISELKARLQNQRRDTKLMMSTPTEPPNHRFFVAAATNRRSYTCYSCSHAFHITPTAGTSAYSPTSFRCPRCLQRHLIPHHFVTPTNTPPPPSQPQPSTFTYAPFNYDSDDDSDSSLLSFSIPSYHTSVPASRSFIDSLPVKVFAPNSVGSIQSCSICMEDFESVLDTCETVTELPCKHEFHKNCIVEWLNRTNTCPLCRYQLPKDPSTVQLEDEETVYEYEESLVEQPHQDDAAPLTMRRVNAEVNLTSVVEAAETGADSRFWSINSGEPSRLFGAMHDEDGDTLMVDA